MNKDLISRSALLTEYNDFKDMDCPSGHTVTADYMIELAEAAPAIDAVEVVRCKDCVWYQPNWIMGQDVCGIIMHNALRVSPNFFCQRGEREEDNNGKDN